MSWLCPSRKVAPATPEYLGGAWGLYLEKLKAAHNEAGVPLEVQQGSAPKDFDELVQKTKEAGSNALFGYVAARRAGLFEVGAKFIGSFLGDLHYKMASEKSYDQIKEFAAGIKAPSLSNEEKGDIFSRVDDLSKEALVHIDQSFEELYEGDVLTKTISKLGKGDLSLSDHLFLCRRSSEVTVLNSKDIRVSQFSHLTDKVIRLALSVLRHLQELNLEGESHFTPAALEGGHPTLEAFRFTGTSIAKEDFPKEKFQNFKSFENGNLVRVYRWKAQPESLKALLEEWKICVRCDPFCVGQLKPLLKEFSENPTKEVLQLMKDVLAKDLFVNSPSTLKEVENAILDACLEATKAKNFTVSSLGQAFCSFFSRCNFSPATKAKLCIEIEGLFHQATNARMQRDGTGAVGKDEIHRAMLLSGILNFSERVHIKQLFNRLKQLEKVLTFCSEEQGDLVIYEMRHMVSLLVRLSKDVYRFMSVREKENTQKEMAEVFMWLLSGYGEETTLSCLLPMQHPDIVGERLRPLACAAAIFVNVGEEMKGNLIRKLQSIPKISWTGYFPYEKWTSEGGKVEKGDIPKEFKGFHIGKWLAPQDLSGGQRNQLLAITSNDQQSRL